MICIFPPKYQISIHAPREGSDVPLLMGRSTASEFQSTLPARGATHPLCGFVWSFINFNPRSPRGERLGPFQLSLVALPISIHAPREGSDFNRNLITFVIFVFQSTLPARGATPLRICKYEGGFYFNPRSPRGERRDSCTKDSFGRVYFNPRSPRGERPV